MDREKQFEEFLEECKNRNEWCGQGNPNALFLARITWNGTLEAIWQVNDPEIVHKYLQNIIAEKSYPREMDYRIEYDAKWENVSYYTQDFSKQ